MCVTVVTVGFFQFHPDALNVFITQGKPSLAWPLFSKYCGARPAKLSAGAPFQPLEYEPHFFPTHSTHLLCDLEQVTSGPCLGFLSCGMGIIQAAGRTEQVAIQSAQLG